MYVGLNRESVYRDGTESMRIFRLFILVNENIQASDVESRFQLDACFNLNVKLYTFDL